MLLSVMVIRRLVGVARKNIKVGGGKTIAQNTGIIANNIIEIIGTNGLSIILIGAKTIMNTPKNVKWNGGASIQTG